MNCYRCGTEESKFWYPYAFGMSCIPAITDPHIDRSQYFMLCDNCQSAFVNFMRNKCESVRSSYIREVMDQ